MDRNHQTDVTQFLSEIDAGRLEAQLGHALSLCGRALLENDGTSKITLSFDLKRVAGSGQIQVASKMQYKHPTRAGELSEMCKGNTLMHVGRGGRLSFMPENQTDLFKSNSATADKQKA